MKNIETYILEIAPKCNEFCNFCYSISYNPTNNKETQKNNSKVMNADFWKKALDNIVANGGTATDFSGGEPTLHPEFPEILEYAKYKGLYVIVSTNGSTISNSKIRDSIDKYVDCVSLSIHGSSSETHDMIKQRPGSFEQVMKSLMHFYNNYQNTGMTYVKINSVVSKDNLDDVINLGQVMDINYRDIQWKLSQAIPREAGKINKEKIEITDDEFQHIQSSVFREYNGAFSQGRIKFREDDTRKKQYSPYMIVSYDGKLYYPKGNEHKNLGLTILDDNLQDKIKKALDKDSDYEKFATDLEENHKDSYERESAECWFCRYKYFHTMVMP